MKITRDSLARKPKRVVYYATPSRPAPLRECIRELLLEFKAFRCPECGVQGKEGKKFCVQCGAKYGVCPYKDCGAPLNDSPTQKFCSKCAKKIPMNESDSAGASGSSSGANPAPDDIQKKVKDAVEKAKAAEENMKIMMAAAEKRFGKQSEFTKAAGEKDKIVSAFQQALMKNDKDAMKKAKDELKAINKKMAGLAAEDYEAYKEWVAAMEKDGGAVPDSFKQQVEKDYKRTSSNIESDGTIAYLEKMESDWLQGQEEIKRASEEANKKLEKLLADLEAKKKSDAEALKSSALKAKEAEKTTAGGAVGDLQKLIGEMQALLDKAGDKASKEEEQAWKEIVEPYNNEADSIRQKEIEIQNQLGELLGSGDTQGAKKFYDGTYKKLYDGIKQYYKRVVPTYVKFYKAVKSQGKVLSRSNLEATIKFLEAELDSQTKKLAGLEGAPE